MEATNTLNNSPDKDKKPSETFRFDKSNESLPLSNKDELNDYHVFLISPIQPRMLPTKPAFSSQRVEHSIPVLSNFRLTDKAQSTSLYRHPTDYTFKPNDKTPDFFASFASKKCIHTNTDRATVLKIS